MKALGSEKKCKEEGKVIQAGKTYVVNDGDIMFFKFNTSKGGKWSKFIILYRKSFYLTLNLLTL